MKKIIAIMLVILAVLSLTACSSSRDAQEQTTQTEYKPTLEVDTEKKGIIAENPTPIDSGKITIGKREYTFPMLVSELTEDG